MHTKMKEVFIQVTPKIRKEKKNQAFISGKFVILWNLILLHVQ